MGLEPANLQLTVECSNHLAASHPRLASQPTWYDVTKLHRRWHCYHGLSEVGGVILLLLQAWVFVMVSKGLKYQHIHIFINCEAERVTHMGPWGLGYLGYLIILGRPQGVTFTYVVCSDLGYQLSSTII